MIQVITIIDDNPLDHLIFERLYHRERRQGNLQFSDDALKTLSSLRKNEVPLTHYPDIILLDLNMPGFSGWEFLAQLSQFYEDLIKPIDVFVLSSSVDPDDRDFAMAFPFVKDFFIKPMTSSVLKRLWEDYC